MIFFVILKAGNGAKANKEFIIGLLSEYRGVSWSIGGQSSDISKSITLYSKLFIHSKTPKYLKA